MISDKQLNQFLYQLQEKQSRIMVVGLGYTGLPLAECIVKAGFKVVGYDTNINKVEMLIRGGSYLETISAVRVQELLDTGRFTVTSDISCEDPCDVYWVCVPTPLLNGAPALDSFCAAITSIRTIARKPFLVVISSTSFPGTTRSIGLSILDKETQEQRTDFFLVFSPEREDPGNCAFTTKTLPRVFGALDDDSSKVAKVLFNQLFDEVHQASSIEAAEASKLVENVYRAVNIALANEWDEICKGLNLDVWEIIKLAATKPFGFQAFYPGPGVGGHCIPVDPYYLLSKLKSVGANAGLINLACDLNKKRPQMIVKKIEAFLKNKSKSINGSNLLLIGLGYKKNISDLRESPAIEIFDLLLNRGCNLKWHDPLIASNLSQRDVQRELELSPQLLKSQDLCVILADHDLIDWDVVLNYSIFILDTRNKFANCDSSMIEKIINF
jgi:UDP-N-acetyl-D-glucosamine dehydrogenase